MNFWWVSRFPRSSFNWTIYFFYYYESGEYQIPSKKALTQKIFDDNLIINVQANGPNGSVIFILETNYRYLFT